jgi:hypothetical protein
MRAVAGRADARSHRDLSGNFGKSELYSPGGNLLRAISGDKCLCDKPGEGQIMSIKRGISHHVPKVPSLYDLIPDHNPGNQISQYVRVFLAMCVRTTPKPTYQPDVEMATLC